MRNVVSVWVLEGTITSLQVAFQEERSARHSGRQGPCPGIRKAATLWPRPPDMQEPGPKETGAKGQLLPGSQRMSRKWKQHTLPTARAVDGLGRKTSVAVGVGWSGESSPPTEVPAHSHKIKGQVRPALKPAANKLWVSWVHF